MLKRTLAITVAAVMALSLWCAVTVSAAVGAAGQTAKFVPYSATEDYDGETKGSWIGEYGKDGYFLPCVWDPAEYEGNDGRLFPSYMDGSFYNTTTKPLIIGSDQWSGSAICSGPDYAANRPQHPFGIYIDHSGL